MNSATLTHTAGNFAPSNADGERAVPDILPADLAFFTTIAKSPLFSTEHAKHLFLDEADQAA